MLCTRGGVVAYARQVEFVTRIKRVEYIEATTVTDIAVNTVFFIRISVSSGTRRALLGRLDLYELLIRRVHSFVN